ncbi:3-hydroxyacyl-CoA dehydrogenase family protein [Vreelandella stevensii]|uniref:3-hydroxyacyl-CoA dehydrogenase family protein n=1 Tax=Vreelandella stevensii TaxID=502821 RepID=UPI0004747FD9|nr:3-hydroxyacyl-CoA dehydrogenase family protein [Halomonas stevensii]
MLNRVRVLQAPFTMRLPGRVAPSEQTHAAVVERTLVLMQEVGQAPILVKREVQGFILNRLQGALLNEALRLFRDGYVSAEDLDKTVKHGLGLRWSFMGPFETIDLNAPAGVVDYAWRRSVARYCRKRSWPNARPGVTAA